jgi:toxin HigB-1
VIKNFKHKGLELYFKRDARRLVNLKMLSKIERILDRLDAAILVEDMDLPNFGLHALKGSRKGYWSVKVSGNWRITFKFEGLHAYEVNLEDYH